MSGLIPEGENILLYEELFMNQSFRKIFYLTTILAVLLMSAVPSYTVYADDGAEGDSPQEVSPVTEPADPPAEQPPITGSANPPAEEPSTAEPANPPAEQPPDTEPANPPAEQPPITEPADPPAE